MKTILGSACAVLLAAVASVGSATPSLTPIEQLGKALFFDSNLSTPPGQSCATCHAPSVGFTGPVSDINAGPAVYPGAVHARAGNRKPPTAAYGGDSPPLHFDAEEGLWLGGMFWDGRATGWTLNDPLAEQALGPFLNNLEQNIPHAKQVVGIISRSSYAPLFEAVWGIGSLDAKKANVGLTYERVGRSIAAYERSREVSPFSSKYDAYLKGEAVLTAQEAAGLAVFEGKGMCSACHPNRGESPLFTDFSYDNLGLPKNPQNPFYSAPRSVNRSGEAWEDPGLAGFLAVAGFSPEVWMPELGKHRVPSLRNVAKAPSPGFVKAFGHNGVFKSLEAIVHFYNTRDVNPWPAPEVPENVNRTELGNLGLTSDEETALVALLKTLNDGYTP